MSRPARLPLEALAPLLLDVPHPGHLRPDQIPASVERLDWPVLFGRPGPVEIEIGFGKGLFLADAARARPDSNFLGVEIERKYVLLAAAKLAKLSLANVKVACTDARWFLDRCVSDASIDALHVYFPDPWWKKRHKKRLLFTAAFAHQASRILRPGGAFHFATDVKEYFDESVPLVTAMVREEAEPSDLMSNFERKYRAEGRPIYRTRWRR